MYRISRIRLADGTLFWQETGYLELPPVLFLHGSWEDSHQWQYIMKLLGKHFHCLAPDLLGFGDSVPLSAVDSIETQVDCLHQWLTALKIDSIHIVGHSLGAWVASSFALRYPEMVQGIVAISPEGIARTGWHEDYPEIDRWLLARPVLMKRWISMLMAIAPLIEDIPGFKATMARWQRLQAFPTTTKLFLNRSAKAIAADAIGDRLYWLKTPVRILQATTDSDREIAQSKAYADAAPQSTYRWLEDLPNLPPHKISRQVAKQIYIFVLRVEKAKEEELSSLW
jgi:pimeloyl-ACP methyl ester carboxylesterase